MNIRVVNITHERGAAGSFLDLGPEFKNAIVRAGGSWQGAVGDSIPQMFQDWAARGLVRILDATNGETLFGAAQDITPRSVSPFREMGASRDIMDEEPDMDEAVEAMLPTQAGKRIVERGAHMPDNRQVQSPDRRASVSLAETTTEVGHVHDPLSPIPGNTPRNVDDSDAFTIKAPRYNSVGSVVGSGRP